MSKSELFQPSTTPEQIRRRAFPSARRGCDPDQVRDYLDAVATRLESLEGRLRDAQHPTAQVQEPAPSPEQDPYEAFGKTMAGLLAAAEDEGARLIKEAKADAKGITGKARSEAARIRGDADAELEDARLASDRVLEQARGQAAHAISELGRQQGVLAGQLEAAQFRLLEAARSLDTIMEEALVETVSVPDGSETSDDQAPAVQADAHGFLNGSGVLDFDGIEFDLDRDERLAPGDAREEGPTPA